MNENNTYDPSTPSPREDNEKKDRSSSSISDPRYDDETHLCWRRETETFNSLVLLYSCRYDKQKIDEVLVIGFSEANIQTFRKTSMLSISAAFTSLPMKNLPDNTV